MLGFPSFYKRVQLGKAWSGDQALIRGLGKPQDAKFLINEYLYGQFTDVHLDQIS